MCGGAYRVSRRVWTEKPADPSPTPWNFDTWGFFCDSCMTFFDLVTDGKIITHRDPVTDVCTGSPEHRCGQPARFISYDREK